MSDKVTYEVTVELVRSKDPQTRARVAERDDVPPEILFFLANDPSPVVRYSIAANPRTPPKADLLLASDQDAEVRAHLARKVAMLLPDLDQIELQAAENRLHEALEILARDQAAKVRRILSETLKDTLSVPDSVIKRLAHDSDDLVSLPLLEFSPLLDDSDLISIIEGNCGLKRLCAISRRNGLGADVSDAIVARNHESAITELLENQSAQIRENTLDALVERATKVADWHAPLVERPSLPSQTARKLTGIVASSLLDKLLERGDLDPETEAAIRQKVRTRLDREQSQDNTDRVAGRDRDQPPEPSAPLSAEDLQRAVAAGDRATVRAGLLGRSKLKEEVVDRIMDSKNPMALTALTWKSGLTMKFAVQLQLRICGVAPDDLLNGSKADIFPMTPGEMNWQVDFFESSYGWRSQWKSAGAAGSK